MMESVRWNGKVEIGGYVGMPERAEQKLEEITGSFSLAG